MIEKKRMQKLKGSIEKAVCTGISARQTACKKLKKNSKRPNHLLQIVGNVVLRLIGRCPTTADRQVPDEPASVRETLSERSKAIGHYYDMLGRKLESLPAHAPYIHNGKKIVR